MICCRACAELIIVSCALCVYPLLQTSKYCAILGGRRSHRREAQQLPPRQREQAPRQSTQFTMEVEGATARSTPSPLSFACVLERNYSFALESTLQAAGFEDEDVTFVKPVDPTNEVVVSGLSLADRAWAAQHASEWRRCGEREGPVLIFQSDVNLSSACASVVKELVAAAEVGAPEELAQVMYLGAADPEGEPSEGDMLVSQCAVAGGYTLSTVHSACRTDTYVLWPAAARLLHLLLDRCRPHGLLLRG